jgi:hypothetical protein
MQHNGPVTLAVTKIDEAAREAIEAAGGRVQAIENDVLPQLFLVTLPVNATIATSYSRKVHDIAVIAEGRDHIMILEVQGPDVSSAHLRYVDSFETSDLALVKGALL